MRSEYKYRLPFSRWKSVIAISDSRAHFGSQKFAVDFVMDFHTKILAAQKGIVVSVKDDSNQGGPEIRFKGKKYQNYITIFHGKQEFSQYVHIEHKSALVKVGDKVKRGQKIASGIGIVGLTTVPHLHFVVFSGKTSANNSVDIRWNWFGPDIVGFSELVRFLKRWKYRKIRRAIEDFETSAEVTEEKLKQLVVDLETLR